MDFLNNELKFSKNTLRIISKKLLDKYDINKTGFLEENEILNLMKDSYFSGNIDINLKKNDIDVFINLYDQDNDGKIGLADIEKYMNKILGSEFENETFEIYDKNEDTIKKEYNNQNIKLEKTLKKKDDSNLYLNRNEIKDLIINSHNSLKNDTNLIINDEIIDNFIKIIDKNNTGKITKNDFNNFIKENLNNY